MASLLIAGLVFLTAVVVGLAALALVPATATAGTAPPNAAIAHLTNQDSNTVPLTPTPTPTPTPTTGERDFQKAMTHVPLPKKGCFKATYPKQEWLMEMWTPSPVPS